MAEKKEVKEVKEDQKVSNIVTTDTKGYGYNYASLADIAKQGVTIPKMKTMLIDVNGVLCEYVFYYDEDLKEWIQGAKVVIPTNKQSNEAQNYGSALTYARRYTTLLARSIATDDDTEIENIKADGTKKEGEPTGKPKKIENAVKVENKTVESNNATPKQIEILVENSDILLEDFKAMNITKPSDLKNLTKEQASALIKKVIEWKNSHND